MSYFAFLDLAINGEPQGEWLRIAASLGHPVRLVEESPPVLDKSLDDFLAEADGFLVFTPTFLLQQSLQDRIHTAIENGKRALVQCSLNELGLYNGFLERYGIEATSLKASLRVQISDHPRTFPVSRTQYPEVFSYPPLLQGCDELVLQQPNVLRSDDRAIPLVSLPLELTEVTNAGDYFENWYFSKVPTAALCDPGYRSGGGVVAFHTTFFHDPYVGPFGTSFPGISGGDNKQLVTNLLTWLARDLDPPTSLASQAWELINYIEQRLARFALKILSTQDGANWWHNIPKPIRDRAEKRRDKEQKFLPARAYLELPDYRIIFETRWTVFARDFAKIGWASPDALKWFDQLRDIRNRTMHPSKAALSGNVISPDEIDFLKKIAGSIDAL